MSHVLERPGAFSTRDPAQEGHGGTWGHGTAKVPTPVQRRGLMVPVSNPMLWK